MFRIIRRTPWIAAGAAAAYFSDSQNGAARRIEAKERLRSIATRMKSQLDGRMVPQEPDVRDTGYVDPALPPSVSGDQVTSPEMAERILEDSERRVTNRAGMSEEHRRSEDTVAPVNAGSHRGS